MNDAPDLTHLDAQQLRELVLSMQATLAGRDREIAFKQALIDKMTHEMAVLKRLKFAAQSERVAPEQRNLLEETIDRRTRARTRERQVDACGRAREAPAQASTAASQPATHRAPP